MSVPAGSGPSSSKRASLAGKKSSTSEEEDRAAVDRVSVNFDEEGGIQHHLSAAVSLKSQGYFNHILKCKKAGFITLQVLHVVFILHTFCFECQ